MKPRTIWSVILCICISIIGAVLSGVVPQSIILHPIFVEVFGTTLGFVMALSAGELVRISLEIQSGEETKQRIFEEIGFNLLTSERLHSVPLSDDAYRMALSTGEVRRFDKDILVAFLGIYKAIALYNSALEKYEFAKTLPDVAKALIDYREGTLEGFRKQFIKYARKLIVETHGEEFLKNLEDRMDEMLSEVGNR